MSFLKKIVNSEKDKIITDLLKEKRALDMELMEMAIELRKIEDDLEFLRSFHDIKKIQ